MYIETWLIIVAAIIAFLIYKSRDRTEIAGQSNMPASIEDVENRASFLKERIFRLEHFDSPHFIDYQDAFDAMEVNYLRLKQKLFHTPEKILEIAKDWYRYSNSLHDLKFARVTLDVDQDGDAWDRAAERMKEPEIIKEETEKKFKSLLGKEFQELPPDYFKRERTMKKPGKKGTKTFDTGEDWKYYYSGSANLLRLLEARRIREKELEESESKSQP